MKSIANRLFLFAAAALSFGTVAYGQTTLKADVPFAFQTPGGTTSAGHYTLRLGDGRNYVQIRNRETGRTVLSISFKLMGRVNEAIAPRLVFRCGDAGCRLAEVWTLAGGYGIPVSHARNPEYIASIPLIESQN